MGSEIVIVPIVVLGLPWLILHYITKWKTAATLTNDDEKSLGDLHDMARYFEDRLETIERIIAADRSEPVIDRLSAQSSPKQIARDAHINDPISTPEQERNH